MAFFSESVRRIDYNGEILPDRYVCFRRNFSLDVIPAEVMLSISAESEYAVYLNGKRLEMTQFPDYPNRKTVSVMDVTQYLEAGENVICVLV